LYTAGGFALGETVLISTEPASASQARSIFSLGVEGLLG
jgi:hypothetical protein